MSGSEPQDRVYAEKAGPERIPYGNSAVYLRSLPDWVNPTGIDTFGTDSYLISE